MSQMNHQPEPIIWIHGDYLSPCSSALCTYPSAPAIWVWDETLLAEWRISFKRVLFIYESLLELPVVIQRGDVATEVSRFAQSHHARTIVTMDSPSPRFQAICRALQGRGFNLEIHTSRPLVKYDGRFDLKRFSRYWREAKKHVF